MDLLFLLLSLLLIVLGWTWYLVPAFHGLPSVHTRRARIRSALKLADLRAGETLYDLGAGDGRVLVIAAKEFGARAVGLEVGPVQCAAAWVNARLNGVADRVRVQWRDFFKADLSAADVVFVYATSAQAAGLAEQLARQLRPGARVVTISFDFPDWEPAGFDNRDLIFLYQMPPRTGNLTTFLQKQP
jgi:SAM-dependent methyltransferase